MDLFGQADIKVAKGAHFSDDRKYRYFLYRVWDATVPLVQFVGLNPSTANEIDDDPTIRRIASFAKDFGYGGFWMTNLFAFVTPYPKELKTCNDPIAQNDQWLSYAYDQCKDIVFCYGSFDVFGRDKEVHRMFPNAKCLGINRNGTPKHPLYLSKNTQLIDFN